VQKLCSALFHGTDLLREPGKIGGQNGRRKLDQLGLLGYRITAILTRRIAAFSGNPEWLEGTEC
jgi:hypothetical protein